MIKGNGSATLNLDGGTLRATADEADYLKGFDSLTLGTDGVIVDSNGFDIGIASDLSGSGGLTKEGDGTLTLTGANSYTGATTIEAGTLALSGAGSIAASSGVDVEVSGTLDISATDSGASITSLTGSGSVVLGSETLTLTDAGGTFSGVISGDGGLAISGGTETLSGENSYSGVTIIKSGATLALAGSGTIAASSGVIDNGTFDVSATDNGASITSLAGSGSVVLGSETLTLTAASGTFSGVISGDGGLTISGGTETLTGTNTYTGTTTIDSGATLILASTTTLSNSSDIVNQGTLGYQITGDVTQDGIISGAGGLLVDSTGTLTLTAVNTYTGATTIESGATLALSGSGSIAASSGVIDNGTFDISTSDNGASITNLTGAGSVVLGTETLTLTDASGTFSGVISGDGGLTINSGTETLSGANTYTGATAIESGATLALSGSGGIATSNSVDVASSGTFDISATNSGASIATLAGAGNVVLGSELLTLTDASGTFSGSISGNGGLSISTEDTYTLSGDSSYTGGTALLSGTLVISGETALGTGTLAMSEGTELDLDGDGLVIANAITLSGDPTIAVAAGNVNTISGIISDGTSAGDLVKSGEGTLILTAVDTYTGPTVVAAGTLEVDGSIAESTVTVADGATLSGIGTAGTTTIESGGMLSAGTADNSIGALTVSGNLTFVSGSTYLVDIAGDGMSDLIDVTGSVTINGGTVTVATLDPQTSYQDGQTYTIITANGGVSGSFDATTTSSAFLTVATSYDATDAYLTISLIDAGEDDDPAIFEPVAETRNQTATAKALDTLEQSGTSLALYNDLLVLDAIDARSAYDSLSGEVYASTKGALIDESRFSRDAITDRIRTAFSDNCARGNAVWTESDAKTGRTAGFERACGNTDQLAFWTRGYGAWGGMDGNGNTAGLDSSAGGFFVGADGPVGDRWRLGIMAGYGRSSYAVDGRSSSAGVDDYTIGAYAGTSIPHVGPGDIGLRFGATHTWHDIDVNRGASFSGFSEAESASYDGDTVQFFGEAGYAMHVSPTTTFEPFAGLAWVNLHTNGYHESGSIAGLSGGDDDTDVTYTTLGLRAASDVTAGNLRGRLSGTLGWRHAFGDITPTATHAFDGSDAFTVAGLPIAKDVAMIEAGFDLDLSDKATLGLAYQGQFGDGSSQNGFTAKFNVKF